MSAGIKNSEIISRGGSKRRRFDERRHLLGGILLIGLLFGGDYIREPISLLLMLAVTWSAMVSRTGFRTTVVISVVGFLIPFTIFGLRDWETFYGGSKGLLPCLEISMELTVLCSMVFGAIIWVKSILKSRRAGFLEVLGACNLYLWIATIFACFYTLISKINPDAFRLQAGQIRGTGNDALRHNFDQFYYFSYVTQTTLGYGDIVPLAHVARALAVTQAIIGQFYVAVVLTYILNLWIRDLGRHVERGIGGGSEERPKP